MEGARQQDSKFRPAWPNRTFVHILEGFGCSCGLFQGRYRGKRSHLSVALGEYDGFFVDEEDGERVAPELLAVLSITEK